MRYTEPRVQLLSHGHTSKGVWGRKAQLTRGFVFFKDLQKNMTKARYFLVGLNILAIIIVILMTGRYLVVVREKREKEVRFDEKLFNSQQIELDYYRCLDSARFGYEFAWREHCEDRKLEKYCVLPKDLWDNLRRIFYESMVTNCKKDQKKSEEELLKKSQEPIPLRALFREFF